MKVSWFSAGVSSFIACYLSKDVDKVIYIDIANQHPDSMRFVHDCEDLLGRDIEILRSEKYSSVDDVIERKRYINGPSGAPCTMELKKRVRQKWERENFDRFTYVWGYDRDERARAERMDAASIAANEFPLIEHGLSKADCHAICESLGLRRPVMYDLGYPNNNCVGCVKGGMGYWNHIRRDFPDVFARRAEQERSIGHSCIKGVFLDELAPDRGRMDMEVMPSCSFMCGDGGAE